MTEIGPKPKKPVVFENPQRPCKFILLADPNYYVPENEHTDDHGFLPHDGGPMPEWCKGKVVEVKYGTSYPYRQDFADSMMPGSWRKIVAYCIVADAEQDGAEGREEGGGMTTFVQQRMPADCVVACMAMFLGCDYEDVAQHCAGYELVRHGLGWHREQHLFSLFEVEVEVVDSSLIDWSEPAILTVPSLNDGRGQTHAIYWDGKRAWDPQKGREGKASYSNQQAKQFAIVGVRRVVS